MRIILANQYKNESKRILEWILYHKTLGIKDFILVDDYSTDNSIEIAESIDGINVEIIPSIRKPTRHYNGEFTNAYQFDSVLHYNIAANFKNVFEVCKEKYGKECIIGYYDIDEFLFSPLLSEDDFDITKIILDEIKDWPVLSLHCFEVNSDKFNLDSWITLQTTNTTNEKNRKISPRYECIKSFTNLSFIDKIDFFTDDSNYIHAGGIKDNYKDTHNVVETNKLAYMHYRKPMYDPEKYRLLFNTDMNIVRKIGKKAYKDYHEK